MASNNLFESLLNIQEKLKVPKTNHNDFGNYDYRSAENILDAVKPMLALERCLLYLSDEIVVNGIWNYVKGIATIVHIETGKTLTVVAYARESDILKGMSSAQITGSTSSYARKYALNGMFLIDDTKDDDTRDNTKKDTTPEKTEPAKANPAAQNPPAKEAKPQTSKPVDLIAEILGVVYKEKLERTEYAIETPEHEKMTIYIKAKPEAFQERQQVKFVNFKPSQWKPKGSEEIKTSYWAMSVSSVTPEEEIPF